MNRVWTGIASLFVAALLASGCQNKVAEDNRQLHQQNRELQAQLDEAHRMRSETPTPAPAPQPTPTVAVQPHPVVPPTTVPAVPAPRPDFGGLEATEDVKAGTTTVSLPGDVFFDPGKDQIKDSAKASLDKVAAALKKEYGGKTVRVEGYTDTDPIKHSHWKSNQELSEARASAVRDYLVKKGVDASRLTVRGLGDTKPKGTKAQSRRVEVVVVTR